MVLTSSNYLLFLSLLRLLPISLSRNCVWTEWSTEFTCKWMLKECTPVLTKQCKCDYAKTYKPYVFCNTLNNVNFFPMKRHVGNCTIDSCLHGRIYAEWGHWFRSSNSQCDRKRIRECITGPLYSNRGSHLCKQKESEMDWGSLCTEPSREKENEIVYDYDGPLSKFNILVVIVMGLIVVIVFLNCYFCNKNNPDNNTVNANNTTDSSYNQRNGHAGPLFEPGIPLPRYRKDSNNEENEYQSEDTSSCNGANDSEKLNISFA